MSKINYKNIDIDKLATLIAKNEDYNIKDSQFMDIHEHRQYLNESYISSGKINEDEIQFIKSAGFNVKEIIEDNKKSIVVSGYENSLDEKLASNKSLKEKLAGVAALGLGLAVVPVVGQAVGLGVFVCGGLLISKSWDSEEKQHQEMVHASILNVLNEQKKTDAISGLKVPEVLKNIESIRDSSQVKSTNVNAPKV